MNKKQTVQNTWTMTDRSVVDMMTKQTRHFPSKYTKNDSSDENSDLESVDSSFGPFAAIPKEFRPFPASLKNEHAAKSLNEIKRVLSNQNPIPVRKDSTEKSMPKIPPPKPPKRVIIEQGNVSNKNQTPLHKSNTNLSKNAENLQNYHRIPNDNTQNKTNVKNTTSGVNREISHQCPKETAKLPQARNVVLRKKEPQQGKGIKYEYVEKLELNFEMPRKHRPVFNDNPSKMGLKRENEMQPRNKGVMEQNKNVRYRFKRDFNKETDTVLCQERVVKWDSSLYLNKLLDNKRVNERNFRKDPHEVLYKENILKRNGSLNLDESSSDDDDNKIEWTVIQEEKITISAKKIESKNYLHNQMNDQCLLAKPRPQNKTNQSKNYRKKNFNKNKKAYKNDLELKNNSKKDNTEFRNSKAPIQCCRDSETLPQQCKVNKDNVDPQEVKNNRPEVSTNTRKNTDDPEPNFYPPKIDNSCRDSETLPQQHRVNKDNVDPQEVKNNKPVVSTNTRKNTNDPEPNFYPPKIDNISVKLTEDQKESMLYYGREMSDLIMGSYNALSLFISMFNEWKCLRLELIGHFEFLEKKLGESSKTFNRYRDLINIAKTGATLASAVPLPHVSIAARVIGVLTSLLSAILGASEKKKMEVEESDGITAVASRDTTAANELYMYGLQCGQTFEETAKLMEEFHSNAGDPVAFERDSPEIATFIRGVLEYRPRHRFFYKKLHKCFQELLHNSASEFGKRLCEPLLSQPAAIDVIGFLDWRFRHEDFNGESVRFELEQIEILITGKDTSINELTVRIRNCVRILKDELKFLEGCVKGISTFFENTVQFEIKERWF